MRNTRKIFLALVLTLAMIAVLSVCAFAFDIDTDLPAGVTKGQDGWVASNYSDIDADNSGWILIGVPSGYDRVSGGNLPKLTFLENGYFYWNKTAKKGVWIPAISNMSANSGTNTVIDPTNPDVSTDAGKKLYTIACLFIDIAEQKKGAYTNVYAGGYIYQNSAYTDLAKTRTLWARYHAKGYAAVGNWENITCTAEQYKMYSDKKAELSATLSEEDLEDALVTFVLENITGITTGRNCLVDGVQYNMGWVFDKLAKNGYVFDTIEFRAGSISAPYLGTLGYVTMMLEVKTVLFDSKITKLQVGDTWRGIFRGVEKLKTVAHVKFANDGTYTDTVAENVVDLTGFKTVTPFSGGMLDHMFYYDYGVENVVYFKTLMADGTENAGWIDSGMFEGNTGLKTFTMNAPLTKTSSRALLACRALTTFDLKGGVAADVTIATNAFSASPTFEALVYDETSKANLEAALAKAGYTTVTVTLVENEEPDVPEEPEEPATMPTGVTNTSDLWIDSGYTDVDTEDGWYMIGISNKNNKVVGGNYPALAYLEGGRFYWNKTTGEAVWLVLKATTAISANWGEQAETAGEKNVLTDGVHFTMAWVFNKLKTDGRAFKCVEFRLEEGSTCNVYSTAGMVTQFMNAETILFDSKLIALAIQSTDRGLFMNNKALKTFDHVTFKVDGSYDDVVVPGVVDLAGFTKVKPFTSASTVYAFQKLLYGSSKIENVIWFDSILSTTDVTSTNGNVTVSANEDLAGVLDERIFVNASSLKHLTLTAPLTRIAGYVFYSCPSFTLDLKGGIAAGATAQADSFYNISNIEIIVYSMADEARARALFVGSKFTITNKDPMVNAITADGFSIRIDDTNAINKGPALRAEFTLLQAEVDEIKAKEGYDLSDYGMVIFSENTLKAYGSIGALVAAIEDGLDENEQKKIKMVSAANGPYVRKNKNGDKTFAAALTGIGANNYDSAVYTYAYTAWTNGDETKYSYTTYTSTRVAGKQAHSLYDATVFAFANGIVNSQNFVMSTGVELWDILQKGAFSITKGEQKAFASTITVTEEYQFDAENKFTYLDLPLYAWRFYKSKATADAAWDSRAHSLEATSSTNVVWSILRDGDNLIVVYRRADGIADDAIAAIPAIRDRSYGGYAPYSSNYMTPGHAWSSSENKNVSVITESDLEYGNTATNGFYKTQKVYSPILSEANEGKITTIVIDYGVNKISGGSLENTTVNSLNTIVYPEGITAASKVFNYNYFVENVIYASDNKAPLAAETQAQGFGAIADLSGMSGLNLAYAFAYARNLQNIILPSYVANTVNEEGFREAYSIKRVWAVNTAVPADGTIDLTAVSDLVSLSKNCFTDMSKNATVVAPTIIMPASYYGVNSYTYALSEPDPCSRIFGENMSFTVVLNDIKALTGTKKVGDDSSLMMFYDMLKKGAGNATATRADNLDNLTFVCSVEEDGEMVKKTMSIAAWRTYLVEKGLYTPAQ